MEMNNKDLQENTTQNQSVRKGNGKIACFIKAVCFLAIGVLIFGVLQSVFLPKRAPYIKSYDAGKLSSFYNEERNSIDVLICSTSHSSKALLPMELYEKYGIKSYNLSTSIQPIEATYYLLCEALETQSPKVFIFDVSNLYFSSVEASYWWFVLDEMHFGKNKLALLREYKENANGGNESSRELLFPLVRYHTRWKELKENDFTSLSSNKRYYGKGGQINTVVAAAETTVDEMNLTADILIQSTERVEGEYSNNAFHEKREDHVLYSNEVPEKNIEWLKKLKALCEENNIELLAVKVPTIYSPQDYRSAWIEEKYRNMQALCDAYDVAYYDFLYDTDIDIDWDNDTTDKGQHLNLSGAQKISADLGAYLEEHYELPNERDGQWDKDLESYRKVRRIGLLEMEGDFVSYLNMLSNEYKDMTILLSVAQDMAAGLNKDDLNALSALGLQADFSDVMNKSYVAVIENGEVKYEAFSNRQLGYNGICDKSGIDYELYSSGWWTGADVSIKVADKEYAVNDKGLNIVVYDSERDLVIDSVCFETHEKEAHIAKRKSSRINGFEEAFEQYIVDIEDR